MNSFTKNLEKLIYGVDLSSTEAKSMLQQIISGKIGSEQVASFLTALRMKGETTEELTAFVQVMREAAIDPEVNIEGAVDLCGTGGDNSGTFNISTAAMFVVAGAGVPVLKHGNRSVSSKCGSADVLETLGGVAVLKKSEVKKVYEEIGMAFMFAPNFHPAMKYIMPARRRIGIRTFFNILGPLLNPAGVKRQVVGAYSKEVARKIAHILANLETEFAYTVNAHDGLDEVSLSSQSEVFELHNTMVKESTVFDPQSLGFEKVDPSEIKGGGAEENAGIIEAILQGTSTDAQRNVVLLNATFGIHAAGKVEHLKEAKELAVESLESGQAKIALDKFVEATQEIAE